MIIDILWILLGFLLLVGGGELIVRGSVAIANKMGLSKALIGATFVGFGTSLPEFVASFGAAAKGEDAIALGNVVGSDIANLLLILGVSAFIFPLVVPRNRLGLDFFFVMLASVTCFFIIYFGVLPIWLGLVLFAVFIVYMTQLFTSDKNELEGDVVIQNLAMPTALFLSLIGIALLVFGADFLIKGSTAIASDFGVSEAIIGITIVGVGTSAPELFASIMASFKKENAIAFGNIIGSNIFNVFAVLGITGIVYPLKDLGGFTLWDGAILIAATLFMFLFAFTRKRISRLEGFVLICAYIGYLAYLILRNSA